MSLTDFWLHSDAFSLFLALVLLALSVASWVVIAWKWRLLRRIQADLPRSIAAFWQAQHLAAAREQLPAFDRDRCVLPLVARGRSWLKLGCDAPVPLAPPSPRPRRSATYTRHDGEACPADVHVVPLDQPGWSLVTVGDGRDRARLEAALQDNKDLTEQLRRSQKNRSRLPHR